MKNKIQIDNKIQRASNFELLRIICMLSIVLFHFADHSIINITNMPNQFNKFYLMFARMGGGLGNCIFIILSGYFLYKSKFKFKKILKLYLQVIFYSSVFGIISLLLGFVKFNLFDFIKMFLPITQNRYWWFTIYFLIYLIFPYLNKIIDHSSFKELNFLMILMFISESIFPTFLKNYTFTNNILIFIFLYFIGAYIRKYDFNIFKNYKFSLYGFIISFILCFFSIIYLNIFHRNFWYLVWPMEKTPIIILSIFMFLLFKNINIKYNKYINTISSLTFGVYLLHIHPEFWIVFWKYIFSDTKIFFNQLFPIYLIIYTLLMFTICATFEYLRIKIIENKLFEK